MSAASEAVRVCFHKEWNRFIASAILPDISKMAIYLLNLRPILEDKAGNVIRILSLKRIKNLQKALDKSIVLV